MDKWVWISDLYKREGDGVVGKSGEVVSYEGVGRG